MNRRLYGENFLPAGSTHPVPNDGSVPEPGPALLPGAVQPKPHPQALKKNGGRMQNRREQSLARDAIFIKRDGGIHHVIAESYSYKTDSYYTVLSLENEGKTVRPSSSAVLDAYVIPVCLEKARRAGIPVCDWGISQAYVPLPALVYGLNYFATNDEYTVVTNNTAAKDVIRHVTNNGKYPFCFQKLPEGSEVISCAAIFGRTENQCSGVAACSMKLYDLFSIPLARVVCVRQGSSCALSSLSPIRYPELTVAERALLLAEISRGETG